MCLIVSISGLAPDNAVSPFLPIKTNNRHSVIVKLAAHCDWYHSHSDDDVIISAIWTLISKYLTCIILLSYRLYDMKWYFRYLRRSTWCMSSYMFRNQNTVHKLMVRVYRYHCVIVDRVVNMCWNLLLLSGRWRKRLVLVWCWCQLSFRPTDSSSLHSALNKVAHFIHN